MPLPLPFRTLRGHLTVLACVATLPAFLFVVYVAASDRKAAMARVESEARYAAEIASREHANQIAGATRLLERLAGLGADDPAVLEASLSPVLSGFPQVANLGLLDPAGRLVYSVVSPPGDIDMHANPAFLGAIRETGVSVGRYQIGEIVGRPVLIMATAIRDAEGRPRTVLFAALELTWLADLARQADVPRDTTLLITDRAGTVLASSGETPRGAGRPARVEPFATLTRTTAGMIRVAGIGRENRLAVASPLRGATGLWVVVGTSERRVRAIVNRVFFRDLAVLALFAAFAVGASILAADVSILRDLRLLARATRRFGDGDLATRSPVPRAGGEIRDVTTAFNAMAAALELRDREATEARETLRALTHRLETIREEEARRIAHELHDELGQELTVLKLELENVRRKVGPAVPAAMASLDGMSDTIDEAIQSVRRIAWELRPGVLDRLGLTAALEGLMREFERRTGIRAVLRLADVAGFTDAETETALFRMTQEAATNVARHSGASLVQVVLGEDAGRIVLEVSDDGRGFDAAARVRDSLGLVGIRERALRLGGSLEIESTAGRGTRLRATVPVREMREAACTAS